MKQGAALPAWETEAQKEGPSAAHHGIIDRTGEALGLPPVLHRDEEDTKGLHPLPPPLTPAFASRLPLCFPPCVSPESLLAEPEE